MSIESMIKKIKENPDYHKAGMILCHNGVVRQTTREGREVTGLSVTVDHGKLHRLIAFQKAKNRNSKFISLAYYCFLTKRIKEVQAKLGENEPGKTKSLVKLEKKLKNWLSQRSLAQILDWFDCVETTKVQTVMGSYRWSTESVARDRLFLK